MGNIAQTLLASNTFDLGFLQGVFYGILVMMLVYNLFMWFSTRQKAYVFYVLYVLFTIVYLLHNSGYFDHIKVAHPNHLYEILHLFKLLAYLFYVVLMRHFIVSVDKYPLVKKVLKITIHTLTISVPISIVLLWLNMHLFELYATMLSFVFLPVVVAVLFFMMKRGEKPERYFVFGSMALFAGAGVLLIGAKAGKPIMPLIYALQVGVMLQVFLFSLGLSYRYQHVILEGLSQKHRALKSEIDPHFFFNSMSVLSSLVYKDPKQAVKYITQLSKVYRNYFDKNVENLVLLGEEIAMLQAYMYLLSIRFGNNIRFKMDVPDNAKNSFYLPPNSLQLLVENAIKHNKCASDEVLTISIHLSGSYLIIENNLNLRTDQGGGSGLGLENIRSRFHLLGEKEIVVAQSAETFIVKLPYYTLTEYESINI